MGKASSLWNLLRSHRKLTLFSVGVVFLCVYAFIPGVKPMVDAKVVWGLNLIWAKTLGFRTWLTSQSWWRTYIAPAWSWISLCVGAIGAILVYRRFAPPKIFTIYSSEAPITPNPNPKPKIVEKVEKVAEKTADIIEEKAEESVEDGIKRLEAELAKLKGEKK